MSIVHGDSVVSEKVRGDGWRKQHEATGDWHRSTSELSLEAVRNQARVLLDRLSDLGEGAAAAARTRTEGGCGLRSRSGGG